MMLAIHPKILLIEAYTDANVGSGALVENSIKLLKSRYPEAQIRVMAHCPGAFANWLGVEAVPDIFEYPYGRSRVRQVVWLCWTVVWMAVVALSASLMPRSGVVFRSKTEHFAWSDLVVSVGAERLNDKFVKNVIFSLYTYWLAGLLRRKLVLFPCTIGPLFHKTTRWLTRIIIGRVDLVYLRDEESADVLNALRIPADRILTTADVAVLQDPAPISAARDLLQSCPPKPWVGLSVMKWTYVRNDAGSPYSNYASYVREMAKLADQIVELHDVSIIFLPTNYPEHGCREDDVATSRQVLAHMQEPGRAVLLERLPTPAQLKTLLGLCEVNIVTRMHACILSTGAGVPTMSINYLFKLRSYMASLGMQEFSLDIERFNAKSALHIFEHLWSDRDVVRNVLQERMAERQGHLSKSMEKLSAVL